MADEPAVSRARCGIPHQIREITCIRPSGHSGFCWSSWAKVRGGAVERAEWMSENGAFLRHHTYNAFYPRNASAQVAE